MCRQRLLRSLSCLLYTSLSEAASLYLPAWLKNTILATAMLAAVATAMAEILGGAVALQMLFGIPIKLGSMMILVLVLICEFTSAYKRIEKLIIVFVSLIGFSFLFEVWIADIEDVYKRQWRACRTMMHSRLWEAACSRAWKAQAEFSVI